MSYALGAEKHESMMEREALIQEMRSEANFAFQAQEQQYKERAARIESEARDSMRSVVSEALEFSQQQMRDTLLEASEKMKTGDINIKSLQSEIQFLTRKAERSLRDALVECGNHTRQELAEQRRVLMGQAEETFRSEKNAYEALLHEYQDLEARRDPSRGNVKMQPETAKYKEIMEKAEAEMRVMREKKVDE